ncbi:Wadjet anti-phage system protein JetD domain-containing protein [Brevibacillus thermoruber]|uniref:Wadjet anti-phage system protein JetD domain-containing protein n=1 Tax=Brevibacillus thermoruber TaxID=33942 RepID=UPI004042A0D0
MYDELIQYLQSYKKTRISLGQLENLADPTMTYNSFQQNIQKLLDNQILLPINKHGTNGKQPPLPLTFRIRKSVVTKPLRQEIQLAQLRVHPLIKLDAYFSLSASRWQKDLPYIERIHDYLTRYGVPQEEATAPERSFHLVGDEKWLDEKGGRKLLETIGVWELLKISAMPDPLMLAVNSRRYHENQSVCHHLIVENKTTFYAIQPILSSTPYTSLIYGAGWKVVSGLGNLTAQLGLVRDVEHRLEYFGDLDHEGIAIWYTLFEKWEVVPAVYLYQALLKQRPSAGKETQTAKMEAIMRFVSFLSTEEGELIQRLLQGVQYLPQEAVEAERLRACMNQYVSRMMEKEERRIGN